MTYPIDLLREHDTACIQQLSPLNRVLNETGPAGLRLHLQLELDRIFDDNEIWLWGVVGLAAVNLAECRCGSLTATFALESCQ